MVLPLVLALMLPATVSVQTGTSVSNETTGGWVSVAPGQASRPTVSTALTPAVQLSLAGRAFSLSTNYNLRLFRRFELSNSTTNQIARIERFLINHTAGANLGFQLQKGWSISSNVSFSLGEVDLPTAISQTTSQNAQLPTPANPTPTTPIVTGLDPAPITDDGAVESITVQGAAGLSGTLNKEIGFDLSFRSSYRGPLGSPDTIGASIATLVPKQTSYGVTAGSAYQLTRLDSFTLTAGATWSLSPRTGNYRSLNLLVGYGRQLGPNSSISAGLGILSVSVLEYIQIDPTVPRPKDSVSPALNLTFGTQLINLREFKMRYSLGTGIASRQNPSTGALEPRLSATTGLTTTIGTRWSVGVQAAFATPASTSARGVVASTPTPPTTSTPTVNQQLAITETTFEVQMPVTYQFSNNFSASAGVIYSNYGPRLAEPDFGLNFPGVRVFLRATMGLSQAL